VPELDLVIRGGRVVTTDGLTEVEIGVAKGQIVEIAPSIGGRVREELDVTGDLVLPGVIDAHVHFNEPGRAEWEGFATGSDAAAAGGVTAVCDMPLNSSPSLLTPKQFHDKAAAAKAHSQVKVGLWGGLTPDNLDQLEALYECGVIGFKAFMSSSGIDDFRRADPETLGKGMEIVAKMPGMRVAVHAEDEALTAELSAKAQAACRMDWRAFVESRPIEAELRAIRQALQLAEQTGCPLHIVHVSSAEGLALVTEAKARGVAVTAETCPHYLFLVAEDLETLGAVAKCAPPLRSAQDQAALWEAVLRGEVDTIGSDHSPCPPEMKRTVTFAEAWGGISGVQHTLPLLLGGLQERGGKVLEVARMLSFAPARLFGRPGWKGDLAVGSPADFCVVSESPNPISVASLRDRHRHSPYVGRELAHRVRSTWVDGRCVFFDP
jgi:allantoinase